MKDTLNHAGGVVAAESNEEAETLVKERVRADHLCEDMKRRGRPWGTHQSGYGRGDISSLWEM